MIHLHLVVCPLRRQHHRLEQETRRDLGYVSWTLHLTTQIHHCYRHVNIISTITSACSAQLQPHAPISSAVVLKEHSPMPPSPPSPGTLRSAMRSSKSTGPTRLPSSKTFDVSSGASTRLGSGCGRANSRPLRRPPSFFHSKARFGGVCAD